MRCLQIFVGHSGARGCWIVEANDLFPDPVEFATRDAAYAVYNALKAAYGLGKDDLRKDLAGLLVVTQKEAA